MELEWQQPRVHSRQQQWHGQQPAPPVSFNSHHQSLPASPPSNFGQRRRSSAANARPSAPPPAFPIPNLPSNPASPTISAQLPPPISELSETTYSSSTQSLAHRSAPSGSFARPSASPNLSAVAAFSQARQASSSTSQNQSSSTMSSSMEDLSDPPPQSYLPSSSRFSERSNIPQATQSTSPERRDRGASLLAPPTDHSQQQRPSSRRALTRALELAREAVQLDSTNEEPEAAVHAYARSVALLSEVMERVRNGEDSTENHRRRRRRSVAAQEEEIRRLQSIHDTYADRMNILSIIYSIPAVPYANPNHVSARTSEPATSPTATSPSPPSDSSPQMPHQAHNHHYQEDPRVHINGGSTSANDSDNPDGVYLDETVLRSTNGPSSLSSSHHPYSGQYDSGQPSHPTSSRVSATYRRTRATSNLPPKAPPPAASLPPAPAVNGEVFSPEQSVSAGKRPENPLRSVDPRPVDNIIHEVVRHRRNQSGLVPLQEENDELAGNHIVEEDPPRRGTPRKESPPLPPLPSPPLGLDATPRNNRPPSSPRIANIISPRPRGTSLQTRNELSNVPYIHPPSNGSISQRRNPPSSRSSSPAESTLSVGSAPYQVPPVSTMPANGPFNGRSRSNSQPGRRPSTAGGYMNNEERPPLPTGPNGTPRKVSVPTKLNHTGPTLQIDLNHLQSNTVAFPNNPTTPVSPLPPPPPSDPVLKPYHMMSLLRMTMTSASGGYVTRRLHVPFEVWSQGGAKLLNLDEKIRVVTVLCDALEELQNNSAETFGAGNVSSGMAMGIGSIGRKEAEAWLSKLDDLSNVCVGVVTSFGKKLGVGEGFVSKKATLGDKLSRRLDKFTNGKNLDSPAAYVHGLKKLFQLAQLLDEHTRAVSSQPISQSYAAFPYDVRSSAEQKLKRFSEFFASVVLTFVIRDLSQLLEKYLKKCEKWLAE